MQNILVPIDFSPESMVAAEVAIQFASLYGASVGLINVVEAPVYTESTVMVNDIDELVNFAMNKMSEVKKVLMPYADTYKVELYTQIEVGFVADTIAQVSQDENSNLIVMSTHGASGLRKALLGSVAASIIDRVNCNMLLIPSEMESATILDIDNMMFAIDYTRENNWHFMATKEIAEMLKVKLTCVHVKDQEEVLENEILFKEFIQANDSKIKIEFEALNGYHDKIDVVEELENFANKNKVGLVALVHHDKSLFNRIFSKSVSKKMALHAKLPLLIFHDNT